MLNKYIIWAFILIIFIRLSSIALPSFRIDMTDWQSWSQRLVELNPTHFYSPTYFSDYFPGYLYILWFLGWIFNSIFPHLSIFSQGFESILKLFTNIFDFATAYYIYKIVYKYQKKLATTSAIFYLINPALMFNSSVWGQIDGILTFFLIYSVYTLLELEQIAKSNLSFALSILLKPQGLSIFPIMIVYLIGNFNLRRYKSILLIPLILILLSMPFFLKDPILGLFHLTQKSTNVYPYTAMFSYNFWSFVGWWVKDYIKFFDLTYQSWGLILYFSALILIILPLIIKKGLRNNYLVYFALALASFSFFLFPTRIHERYLFPLFSFLLIVASIKKSFQLYFIYGILSFIHFINIWYVYYYYNYVYQFPEYSSFSIYKFLAVNYNGFSLLNIALFGVLLFKYYEAIFVHKKSIK